MAPRSADGPAMSNHSMTKSNALATKRRGTRTAVETAGNALAPKTDRTTDSAAAAKTAAGNAVVSRLARNRASRLALPATN